MKSNDIKALHDKSIADLSKQLLELRGQLAMVRLEKSAGKQKSGVVPSRVSDDIARIKTIITEKEFAQSVAKSEKKETKVKAK